MTNREKVSNVSLRKIPTPYRAMLAICSDLDETPSLTCYLETSKYLNTSANTPFGKGIGLEIGNSIYFHMATGEFSYFNTSKAGRESIRELIRSGHIDCLHSFGDTALSRSEIERSLADLERHECRIKVWIDHATAPSNFGQDIMKGHGDDPGSDVYHADLTIEYGIQYVWCGRVTSMIGQDASVSMAGIMKPSMPLGSATTLLKEMVKVGAARFGNRKYAMHRDNAILRDICLRDSQPVYEFLRTNPHPLGVSFGDNALGLGEVLSEAFLSRLASRSAKSIIYTHLGKKIDEKQGLPETTVQALRSLKRAEDSGDILVTTTRKLLEYTEMHKTVIWNVIDEGPQLEIAVARPRAGISLQGLSFVVPDNRDIRLTVDGQEVGATLDSISRVNGSTVLSLPWQRLSYPL